MSETEDRNIELQINSLLLEVETNSEEIKKLRDGRREHAGWLNRHNLEIDQLQLRVGEIQATRIAAVEADVQSISNKHDALAAVVGSMASDMKTLSWKVGVIIGVFVFLAQQAMKFIHF